ncbi:MAG: hypothetical protein C0490_15575, partial [Marivirga sp.]|nr:hypothetical protein [Marivirga sp.]
MKIFISYRRSDTSHAVKLMHQKLHEQFQGGKIFRDVDSIASGTDFKRRITDAIAECHVVLAIIGERWFDAKKQDPKKVDFVKFELKCAKRNGITIIPVLVGNNTKLPDDLPRDLRWVLGLHVSRLRDDPDWDIDMDRLVNELKKVEAGAAASSEKLRQDAQRKKEQDDKERQQAEKAANELKLQQDAQRKKEQDDKERHLAEEIFYKEQSGPVLNLLASLNVPYDLSLQKAQQKKEQDDKERQQAEKVASELKLRQAAQRKKEQDDKERQQAEVLKLRQDAQRLKLQQDAQRKKEQNDKERLQAEKVANELKLWQDEQRKKEQDNKEKQKAEKAANELKLRQDAQKEANELKARRERELLEKLRQEDESLGSKVMTVFFVIAVVGIIGLLGWLFYEYKVPGLLLILILGAIFKAVHSYANK